MTDNINPPHVGHGSATDRPDLPQRQRNPFPDPSDGPLITPVPPIPSAPVAGGKPMPTEGLRTKPNTSGGAIAQLAATLQKPMGAEVKEFRSGYTTLVAMYIIGELVPEWEELFSKKNAGYGEYDDTLGIKGEFAEIHRKYRKLLRAFWEETDTSDWDEQPREVLMDLIGHCFLAIHILDEEGKGDSSNNS